MDILFLLIPIALAFLVIAIMIFFWAIRDGQYDDMESQGLKVIIDDKQQAKRDTQSSKDPVSPNDTV